MSNLARRQRERWYAHALVLSRENSRRAHIRTGEPSRFLRTLQTTGTKNSVAKVTRTSPPITARPRGAFRSPPSPRASDKADHAERIEKIKRSRVGSL